MTGRAREAVAVAEDYARRHWWHLASQLGVEFFDENLSSLCLSWLGDSV